MSLRTERNVLWELSYKHRAPTEHWQYCTSRRQLVCLNEKNDYLAGDVL
jgi:hypothetical protein